MSKFATAAKTYFQMLRQSFSSFHYYQNLPQLTRTSIVIFFIVSFFLFNFIFSGISLIQIERDPEVKTQFGLFIDAYVASLSASLTPTATFSATPAANLIATDSTLIASASSTSAAAIISQTATTSAIAAPIIDPAISKFFLANLPLIFLVVYPILGVVFTLPTILIETFVIYFIGRFEKRGLTVWSAAALSIHTTLIVQLLNQIIALIYPNPIPDVLYLLHWVFIIFIVHKYYPLSQSTLPKKKASTHE